VTVARVNLRTVARHLAPVLHNPTLEAYAVDSRGVVVLHADTTLMLAQRTAPSRPMRPLRRADAGATDGLAGRDASARPGWTASPCWPAALPCPPWAGSW
jgi:hypothetical protein